MRLKAFLGFFLTPLWLLAQEEATVSSLSLEEYQGLWYEIMRLPNTFQKHCAKNVTALYTLRPDGTIGVQNACVRQDNTLSKAHGTAWRPHAAEPGRLKVSFVPFLHKSKLFGGDYWVLEYDQEKGYAMVGHPKKRFFFLLSRSKTLSPALKTDLMQRIQDKGYDVSHMIHTVQE